MDKVLGYNPTAYWPLDELVGAVAEDKAVNLRAPNPASLDGAYTGVTLNDAPGPDGRPTPLFDGTNDFVDVLSAGLIAAFDEAEGSLMIWGKMFNVGVWTDGDYRMQFLLRTDGQNQALVQKQDINNTLRTLYRANNVSEELGHNGGLATTGWFHRVLTWSKSGEVAVSYYNGGDADTGITLGVWAGALAIALIGSWKFPPNDSWYGWLAHCALWAGTVLTPAQIADLFIIP